MLYEIRRYRTLPGRRSDWIRFMEEAVLPLHAAAGVAVLGTFMDEDDDDVYVWIRAFEDEDARAAGYREIYQSEAWLTDISPRVDQLLDRSSVTKMTVRPTARSPLA
ncbi:NIPSNAP family protein [Microbacterium sp. A94]|uniref:NIPSNAP family protein n=1 Tax=Microbacterium sp. A94 TaxID=3450717 RepID=UPI003F4256DB